MAGFPREWLDQLLQHSNLVDIVASRLPGLTAKGNNHWACCPFHQEHTPSFSVSQEKQFYYCFGCGAKGNAIDFVMQFDSLPFVEAVRSLASTVGMALPEPENHPNSHQTADPFLIHKQALTDAGQFFQNLADRSTQFQQALQQRQISAETAKLFGLGWAPAGWHHLRDHLLQKGYQESLLVDAGLCIVKSAGANSYDRFRERLMFPIRNRQGQIIAFGGRTSDSASVKYLNSPEAPWFHKKELLYGMYEAKQWRTTPLLPSKNIILVEGYMDVLRLQQAGVHHSYAVMGTSLAIDHLRQFRRLGQTVYLCFDGDDAGRQAALKTIEQAFPIWSDQFKFMVIDLPEKEDPDSLIQNQGIAGWKTCFANAKDSLEYWWEKINDSSKQISISEQAASISRAKAIVATMATSEAKNLLQKRLHQEINPTYFKKNPIYRQKKQAISLCLPKIERLALLLWAEPSNFAKLEQIKSWQIWRRHGQWPNWWNDFENDMMKHQPNHLSKQHVAGKSWSFLTAEPTDWLPKQPEPCWQEISSLLKQAVEDLQWFFLRQKLEKTGTFTQKNMLELKQIMKDLNELSTTKD